MLAPVVIGFAPVAAAGSGFLSPWQLFKISNIKARNKSRNSVELANLKAVGDNIASYGINESSDADLVDRLWPSTAILADASSYIRKQLFCPITRDAYSISVLNQQGSCDEHGMESEARTVFGG